MRKAERSASGQRAWNSDEMAMQLLLLDVWGLLASIAVAGALYYFGGIYAAEYLALMLIFLFAGTIVTTMGKEKKEEMGIYEYGRSWQNVLANGFIPVAAAATGMAPAYFGAIASITADKFSSELGALGGTPIFLGTMKPVKKGTSGAITLMGSVAGLIGAEIIAISVYFLFPDVRLVYALALPFVGLFGSFVDSVAGIFETYGYGNKATSNIAGAIGGAVLGEILFLLLR